MHWRKWRYWRYRQKRQYRHAKNCMTNLTKLTKLTRKFVKMVNLVIQIFNKPASNARLMNAGEQTKNIIHIRKTLFNIERGRARRKIE